MAESYSRNPKSYSPASRDMSEFDEDPLVELARIVSEDGVFHRSGKDQQRQPASRVEPSFDADPFSADLEVELMQELEQSLSRSAPTPMPAPPPAGGLRLRPAASAPARIEPVAETLAPDSTRARVEAERPLQGNWPADAGDIHADLHSNLRVEAAEDDAADDFDFPFDDEIPAEYDLDPAQADPEPEWDESDLDPFGDEEPPAAAARPNGARRRLDGQRTRRRRPALVVAGVLGVAAIGAAAAGALSFWGEGAPSGPPPVITAEAGAMKVRPEAGQAAASADQTGQAVYDNLAGSPSATDEQIVDRTEEPREIARVVMPGAEANQDGALMRPVEGGVEATSDVARDGAAGSAATEDFDAIGPRRVRTVVVRPDGTIVSASDQPTQTASIRADQPTEVASLDTSASLRPVPVRTVDISLAPEGEPAGGSALPDVAPVAGEEGEAHAMLSPDLRPAGEVGDLQALDAPAVEESANALLPRPRPAAVAQSNASAAVQSAPASGPSNPVDLLAAAPASQPTAEAAQPATGRYMVQLSSQRSQAQAEQAFAGLQGRYPSLLGSYQANIEQANIADRGTYYRVRVGPMASNEASSLCERLKSAGGTCFVTR